MVTKQRAYSDEARERMKAGGRKGGQASGRGKAVPPQPHKRPRHRTSEPVGRVGPDGVEVAQVAIPGRQMPLEGEVSVPGVSDQPITRGDILQAFQVLRATFTGETGIRFTQAQAAKDFIRLIMDASALDMLLEKPKTTECDCPAAQRERAARARGVIE